MRYVFLSSSTPDSDPDASAIGVKCDGAEPHHQHVELGARTVAHGSPHRGPTWLPAV